MSIISDCECRRKQDTNCTLDTTCKVVPSCSLMSLIRPQMLCAGSSGAKAKGISFVRFVCFSSSRPVCVHKIFINAFIKKLPGRQRGASVCEGPCDKEARASWNCKLGAQCRRQKGYLHWMRKCQSYLFSFLCFCKQDKPYPPS